MKKFFLAFISLFGLALLSGCGNKSKTTWQGSYYDGGNDDSDIVYGPIFTNYEGCKDWAISNKPDAHNAYVLCSKNCHDSMNGTPICEEVVRSWQPLPGSNTFDNYIE